MQFIHKSGVFNRKRVEIPLKTRLDIEMKSFEYADLLLKKHFLASMVKTVIFLWKLIYIFFSG